MFISGMSGNEIYCLALKGYVPGELTVGNSVQSLGVAGGLSSFGRTLAGGEIGPITEMISNGRHLAITRMEDEAKKHGAAGVTGVFAELRTLAGYTEFLAQGTAVHTKSQAAQGKFFSTAASGIELYCHLDAGYQPMKFALGNVAYALGISRGVTGSLRGLARGEVKEFSQMYNEIRHTALDRLRKEAAAAGANAVVDVDVRILPFGPGTVEFLVTGTASNHPNLPQGKLDPKQVVTSSLSGEELWNLAKLGFVPKQLVMATSIYALGFAGGCMASFQSLGKGELPEVTKLVYDARENCMELIRKEAQALGAAQVIGNRLTILEISPGMLEVFGIGTAIAPMEGDSMKPHTDALIPQAVITEESPLEIGHPLAGIAGGVTAGRGGEGGGGAMPGIGGGQRQQQPPPAVVIMILLVVFGIMGCAIFGVIVTAASKGGH